MKVDKNNQKELERFNGSNLLVMMILLKIFPLGDCINQTPPTPILTTTQFHYINNGSYFQFTFTRINLELFEYNTTISQFTVNFTINVVTQTKAKLTSSQGLLYNLLIFPQADQNSVDLYQSYVKAVVEGLPGLMPQFQVVYSQPQTKCQDCYQRALYSNVPTACLKCSATILSVNLTSDKWVELNTWNSIFSLYKTIGTTMTVIDNSFVVSPTGGPIQLHLGYAVNISYDEEYQALLILYLSVIGSLILILGIVAVFLTIKIKKVQKQITQCKQKIKIQ